MTQGNDEELEFTVAAVWREERVSCPHPDILRAYQTDALEAGAMQFVTFHLEDSQCPFCHAVLEDLRLTDEQAAAPTMSDLRDKLMRSTVAALRKVSGS